MQQVIFRLQDDESDGSYGSEPIFFDDSVVLADVQAATVAFATLLDKVAGSKVVAAELTLGIDLSGATIKADPVTNITNERGGLISFTTSGPNGESFRIPGIDPDIMSGDAFSIVGTDVAALIAYLNTNHTINTHTVRLKTPQGYNYVTARKGVRSRRKS